MGKLGIEFSQITLTGSKVCLGKVNLAMQKAPEPRAPGGSLWEWRENESIHSSASPAVGQPLCQEARPPRCMTHSLRASDTHEDDSSAGCFGKTQS